MKECPTCAYPRGWNMPWDSFGHCADLFHQSLFERLLNRILVKLGYLESP